MFPQELIIKLGGTAQSHPRKDATTNAKLVVVERCEGVAPISWEKVFEMEAADTDGRLQVESNTGGEEDSQFSQIQIHVRLG